MAEERTDGAGPTKIGTVEEILAAVDLEERVVHVPEWKVSVRVRGFTKAKQQEMRKDATVKGELDFDRLEMLMFIQGVVEPEFTKDRYEQLRQKSAGAIDRVLREILTVSGLREEDLRRAETSFRGEE